MSSLIFSTPVLYFGGKLPTPRNLLFSAGLVKLFLLPGDLIFENLNRNASSFI